MVQPLCRAFLVGPWKRRGCLFVLVDACKHQLKVDVGPVGLCHNSASQKSRLRN